MWPYRSRANVEILFSQVSNIDREIQYAILKTRIEASLHHFLWKVEQYLFVNESYQSNNDPDYEIGETTCDFDGSSSETESDEESVDTKGFLCQECRDECGNKCNGDGKSSGEEPDGGVTSDEEDGCSREVECSREEDNEDYVASSRKVVREITLSFRPEIMSEAHPNEDSQKIGPGSPTCKKG